MEKRIEKRIEEQIDKSIIRKEKLMERHEYKCILILGFASKRSAVLNEYAADGWELVCVFGGFHYLKRTIK